MFKSATIKLTLWYVFIVMILCLIFSGVLYHFSNNELAEGLHKQYQELVPNDHDSDDYLTRTKAEIAEQSHNLLVNLIYFNVVVLLGAGLGSYVFARNTLKPIKRAHQSQLRFTADASHELRTPLTSMKADTEATLMRYSDSVPQLRRALAENLTDIQKLDKLTNQLLEISKLDSRHPISKEIVDIEEVIKLVMNSFNRKTKTSTINVDIQSTGYYILANEQSIRQLLTIVLDNAVKYSPSKGRVQVSVVKQSKHVLLTVRDNGIGIPKDDLPHIFERFYRSKNASTSKRKITGYGLGLPLAKDIVELYGGTIRIDSKENVSTTVTISLPLYKLDK